MDPSPKQRELISRLRATFGAKAVKTHAPDPRTGVIRLELPCEAGVWQWYFDTDGTLKDKSLTGRLFEPPTPVHKPKSAIDN